MDDERAREHEPAPDRPDEVPTPAPQFRHSPSRCPYCHDACTESDDVAVCRRCLAPHHAECWSAAKSCGTCRGERVLHEITIPAQARRAAYRDYVDAVAREPRWVRLALGVLFSVLTVAAALFGVFVIHRAFVAPFQGPVEWLIVLPFCLFMFVLFPGWVSWRAARLRLWPTSAPSAEPTRAGDAVAPKVKADLAD